MPIALQWGGRIISTPDILLDNRAVKDTRISAERILSRFGISKLVKVES